MSYQGAGDDEGCPGRRGECTAEALLGWWLLGGDEGRHAGLVRGSCGRTAATPYRLFCRLDYEAKDQSNPLLVVIDGRAKAFRTELSAADYLAVRALGDEYLARNPRSIA